MDAASLAHYWREVFPLDALETTLLAPAGFSLEQREFALCFQNGERLLMRRRDAYRTPEALRRALAATPATRLNLGPLFPDTKRGKEAAGGVALYNQLWFDLDINDVQDRGCTCDPRAPVICVQCWKWYMVPAIHALDYVLRDFLGFTRVLWVFSGRRGVHAAVLDERVLEDYADPTTREKGSVLRRDTLYQVVQNPPPNLLEAVVAEVLRPHVDKLAWPGRAEWLECRGDPEEERRYLYRRFYPKLDAEITRKVGHLAKCPFSPHSNGNVSVPFRPEHAADFDPTSSAPTVAQLHRGDGPGLLAPFVEVFRKVIGEGD